MKRQKVLKTLTRRINAYDKLKDSRKDSRTRPGSLSGRKQA